MKLRDDDRGRIARRHTPRGGGGTVVLLAHRLLQSGYPVLHVVLMRGQWGSGGGDGSGGGGGGVDGTHYGRYWGSGFVVPVQGGAAIQIARREPEGQRGPLCYEGGGHHGSMVQ